MTKCSVMLQIYRCCIFRLIFRSLKKQVPMILEISLLIVHVCNMEMERVGIRHCTVQNRNRHLLE